MARKRHGIPLPSSEERARQAQNDWIICEKGAGVVRTIADAVPIKHQGISMLTDSQGSIPLNDGHGFGIYYNDCRFVSGYELTLGDVDEHIRPVALAALSTDGFLGHFQLANPPLKHPDGRDIPKDRIKIELTRVVDGSELAVHERIALHNFGDQPVIFPLTLSFSAHFEDMFQVRGLTPEKIGHLVSQGWKDNILSYIYLGIDETFRSTHLYFWPAPDRMLADRAEYLIKLEARESLCLQLRIQLCESRERSLVGPREFERIDLDALRERMQQGMERWYAGHTSVTSEHELFDRIMHRSLHDLHTLETRFDDVAYFSAGIPWYIALFGRDTLITALETLAYDPMIAEQTLKLLASHQGRQMDSRRDEEPGKILHEYRFGELTRAHALPYFPYFGTVDATPLFLILLCEHCHWVGNFSLLTGLQPHVDAALEWLDHYSDLTQEGYASYQTRSSQGMRNQGWKDSGDAIVNADGSLAEPPIALVEVQGFVYKAKIMLADLYRRMGQHDRAEALQRSAHALRQRFNHDFWYDDLDYYALALQKGNKPCKVIASNPGQALWTGIVDPDRAEAVVKRLMHEDMFSGWGIRTLSKRERRYNPMGYHLGTVWPQDNGFILAGMRRYGFDEEALRLYKGLFEAVSHFNELRMPEVFTGYSIEEFGEPVRYSVACHPQAWSAGTMPFMLQALLGLNPMGLDSKLQIRHPLLPPQVQWLDIKHLKVGTARVDLHFERARDRIHVEPTRIEGKLSIDLMN